jgi:hypothetical protein
VKNHPLPVCHRTVFSFPHHRATSPARCSSRPAPRSASAPLHFFQAWALAAGGFPLLAAREHSSGAWMGFLLAEALFICGFVMSYLGEMHCCLICRWFLNWTAHRTNRQAWLEDRFVRLSWCFSSSGCSICTALMYGQSTSPVHCCFCCDFQVSRSG